MNVRIATAPDSWGDRFPSDKLQTPWSRFMDEPSAWQKLERQVNGAGDVVPALGTKFLILIDGIYTGPLTG